MRRIEGQGAAASGACAPASQRLAPGKLAHLARELASMMGRDRQLTSERITADYVDRAFEHEPGRSVALPDVEHSFARLEMPWRAAGETLGGLDLAGVERRKHLVKAGLDDAHGHAQG